MEYQGCLKCRKFFAGHHAHQYTMTISGKGYKTLTHQDAQHAKSVNAGNPGTSSQMNTVASVTEAPPTEMNDFLATVFPNLSSGLIEDGSFSEGEDSSFSSSMSTPPPLKSKHFIWNCSLMGPSVILPVIKLGLIDNSCHMVLIRPDLVNELGLPIFALKEPEVVDVAIFFSRSGIARKKHSLYNVLNSVPFPLTLFSNIVSFMLFFVLVFACLLFLDFLF